jgi:hypothetical protein
MVHYNTSAQNSIGISEAFEAIAKASVSNKK